MGTFIQTLQNFFNVSYELQFCTVFIALFVVNELLLQAEIRKMNALPYWTGTELCQNLLEQEIRKTSVEEVQRCRAHISSSQRVPSLFSSPLSLTDPECGGGGGSNAFSLAVD